MARTFNWSSVVQQADPDWHQDRNRHLAYEFANGARRYERTPVNLPYPWSEDLPAEPEHAG